ncbi:uncharacterized protein B0I36DRAFT_310098 [Microdochium trichocladiopsis]|uniref:Uncharacterized protein n=1 Tax=Microdochium trichocladiopsis TaxID=1682393 RepID=A0A9P8YIW2_9PEZI|nr:uncharacterized protein B0I36DRAFT_310098 [Microdochium trichocladiopsis]KAH7040171.1 hypothetical protein B0I36DRAFT_310098 [Microdochium trichocladiopsis]
MHPGCPLDSGYARNHATQPHQGGRHHAPKPRQGRLNGYRPVKQQVDGRAWNQGLCSCSRGWGGQQHGPASMLQGSVMSSTSRGRLSGAACWSRATRRADWGSRSFARLPRTSHHTRQSWVAARMRGFSTKPLLLVKPWRIQQ